MADVILATGPQSSSSLRPCFSLMNEIRRCTRVRRSTVQTLISKPKGRQRVARWILTLLGSPSFVAVMQSPDLETDRGYGEEVDGDQAVPGGQFRALSCGPLKHADLVAQSQVLELNGSTRTED